MSCFRSLVEALALGLVEALALGLYQELVLGLVDGIAKILDDCLTPREP